MRITKSDVTTRRTDQGAWQCSAVIVSGIGAYLEHQQYFGYTKRQAINMFIEYCKAKDNA